jgi:acyl-coenzyme A thioesterase PaaI-like protein
MSSIAFQDQYLDSRADCWGCGRNNHQGLQIKSFWDGEEAVARYSPESFHSGHKGIVNGGIIATLIDCHCIGLAMADAHRREEREIGSQPLITYVTASLKVDYLKPTFLENEAIELRAEVDRVEGKKTYISCSLFSEGIKTAQADVLGIKIDEVP